MAYDIAIASYILNPTDNKLDIERLMQKYLSIDVQEYVSSQAQEQQINLFDTLTESKENNNAIYGYAVSKIKEITLKKLQEIGADELFYKIDMPTIEVLSDMQWNGMYVDKQELENFGQELTFELEKLTKKIYELAGEEFNINSTKQLGEILFEKMKLPVIKKTKSGYSTDVDVLEKLKREDTLISNR